MTQKTKSKTTIKFVLPDKLKAELQQLAERRNISVSALLRLIVTNYIKERGQAW